MVCKLADRLHRARVRETQRMCLAVCAAFDVEAQRGLVREHARYPPPPPEEASPPPPDLPSQAGATTQADGGVFVAGSALVPRGFDDEDGYEYEDENDPTAAP